MTTTTETFNFKSVQRPSIKMDPEAVLDYTFDWTDWLDAVSDTIASKVVVGTNVTVNSSSIDGTAKMVTVWASGGAAGVNGKIECKITTVGGRVDERTIYLVIEER